MECSARWHFLGDMHIFHHSPTRYRNNGLRSRSRQSVSIRVGDLSIHGPACKGPCPGTASLWQFKSQSFKTFTKADVHERPWIRAPAEPPAVAESSSRNVLGEEFQLHVNSQSLLGGITPSVVSAELLFPALGPVCIRSGLLVGT